MLRLDPTTTAILVVDMQNDFCHPEGYYAANGRDVSPLGAVIPMIAELTGRARSSGALVAYTKLTYHPVVGPMEARHTIVPEYWVTQGQRLLPGTWGVDVLDALAPQDGDLVIEKVNYSAFEGTDLDGQLRARGIRTIVLCGVVTYACVLSSGFSAFDRGFDVVLATDASGCWIPELGAAAGEIVGHLLGRSVTIDAIAFAPSSSQLSSNKAAR